MQIIKWILDIPNRIIYRLLSWLQSLVDGIKSHYWLITVLYCLLFFLRDVFNLRVSYNMISIITMGIILILPIDYLHAFVLSVYIFSAAGFSGLFSVCVLIAVVMRTISCFRFAKMPTVYLLIMVIFELFHSIVGHNVNFGTYIALLSAMICFAALTQIPEKYVNKNLLADSFILFACFFVSMSFIQMLRLYGSVEGILNYGMRTRQFQDLITAGGKLIANPNYLTVVCSTGIGISLLRLSQKHNKIPYFIAISIFVFIGLTSVSKMFIGIIALLIIYITYSSFKRNLKTGILATFALAAVSGIVYFLFKDTLIDAVLRRFQVGDLTTGRVDIIHDLFAYMNEKPYLYIIGNGILELVYVMLGIGSGGIHNSFFEVLGGWGIPGIFVVIGFIVSLVKHVQRIEEFRTRSLMKYLPLTIVLVYSMAGMLFSSPTGISRLLTCIYVINCKSEY